MERGKDFTVLTNLLMEAKLETIVQSSKNRGTVTLIEHTRLCQMYFESLWTEKDLGGFFLKFQDDMLVCLSEEAKQLYRQMLFDIITFHSLGKVYCAQSEIQNDYLASSALLYLNYFYQFVNELDEDDRKTLLHILFHNTYAIISQSENVGSYIKFLSDSIAKVDELFDMSKKLIEKLGIDILILEKDEIEDLFLNEISFYSESDIEFSKKMQIYEQNACSILYTCNYFANQQNLYGKVFLEKDLILDYWYENPAEKEAISC